MPHRALAVLIMTAGAGLLHAQAMIEYGVSAGRSGAAAGAAGAGKSSGKIFDKLSGSLAGAAKTDSSAKPASSAAIAIAATPVTPAAPAPPPDFTSLVTGMDRADLLKKVGKPSMSMTSMESSKLVETCWYRSGADSRTVILRDGKVAEISEK